MVDYKLKETYNFNLPNDLIATHLSQKRVDCKLMTLNIENNLIEHKHFFDIIDYFKSDDLLILNDTKVIPARLFLKKTSGASVEILLLEKLNDDDSYWSCLVKGRNIKEDSVLYFDDEKIKFSALIVKNNYTTKDIKFSIELDKNILNDIGSIPLPPYIIQSRKNNGESEYTKDDREFYQNVFAKNEGSVASPTSGLHFNNELLNTLKDKGVKIEYLTLHIGFGTFNPLKADNLEDHIMHKERFVIPKKTADLVLEYKSQNKRVIACGTTVSRVLESQYTGASNSFSKLEGSTDIFIYPPYKFNCVDAMITNFHTPESTLLAMVSAFAGYENIMNAYNEAIKNKYHFFSYGDAMFLYK